MRLATREEIEAFRARHPGWRVVGRGLARIFTFDDYAKGVTFAAAVGLAGDDAGHHPDMRVCFKRSEIRWTTHDEGGITGKDIAMARKTDRIFSSF